MKLFNTLTSKKQVFKPLRSGNVSMYACGPTVYQSPHIGNMRSYLFEDILRRVLEYNGYDVKHIINVTDVGHLTGDGDIGADKVEESAKSKGVKASDVTKKYFDEFKTDMKALNILMPAKFAWATKYIPEQKKLVERIFSKKYAYETEDGIYFDTQKFGKYGKLGGLNKRDPEEMQSRTGVDPDKKHPFDFALWKFSIGPRLQEWKSPVDHKKMGFPGWHLECSAISTEELGQPFDIHAGGIDHVTTHHNNEIAQSEAAYGKPLANYWIHGEHLLMKDTKMSKSLGNVALLADLTAQGFEPLAFRYLVLTSQYRNRLNFTEDGLEAAQTALNKLRAVMAPRLKGGKVIEKYQKKFKTAVSDDLNTAEGLAVVWEMVKSKAEVADIQATLLDMDQVLGLGLDKWKPAKVDKTVLELAEKREQARANKEWAESDRIRDEINKKGYDISDTPNGYQLIKR